MHSSDRGNPIERWIQELKHRMTRSTLRFPVTPSTRPTAGCANSPRRGTPAYLIGADCDSGDESNVCPDGGKLLDGRGVDDEYRVPRACDREGIRERLPGIDPPDSLPSIDPLGAAIC